MKVKYLFVALLVLLNFVSYFYEGYLSKASILFNTFYAVTLLVSAFILCRLELKPLVIFSLSAVLLGFCAEYLNTKASNWTYFGSAQPPLFVAVGWVSLLAAIFYGAGLLKKFGDWKMHPVLVPLLCFGFFFLFSFMERNITVLTIGLYLIMAVLGTYSAISGTFSWNAALLVVAAIIGSLSEALGASCVLWSFRSGQLLPLPMVLWWSVNAFCLSGIMKLLKLSPEKLFG